MSSGDMLATVEGEYAAARDQEPEQACEAATGRAIAGENLVAIERAAAAAGLPIIVARDVMAASAASDPVAEQKAGPMRQLMVRTLCMTELQSVK